MTIRNTVESILARAVVDEHGCLVFPTTNPRGYGMASFEGRARLVHRLAWESHNGPLVAGLEIDHLCHNRACCRIDHLEPVSRKENVRRRRCTVPANPTPLNLLLSAGIILLSTQEAAARLGISESGMRLLIRQGKIAACRVGARCWAIEEQSLSAYKRGVGGRPRRVNGDGGGS